MSLICKFFLWVITRDKPLCLVIPPTIKADLSLSFVVVKVGDFTDTPESHSLRSVLLEVHNGYPVQNQSPIQNDFDRGGFTGKESKGLESGCIDLCFVCGVRPMPLHLHEQVCDLSIAITPINKNDFEEQGVFGLHDSHSSDVNVWPKCRDEGSCCGFSLCLDVPQCAHRYYSGDNSQHDQKPSGKSGWCKSTLQILDQIIHMIMKTVAQGISFITQQNFDCIVPMLRPSGAWEIGSKCWARTCLPCSKNGCNL